MMGVFLTVLGAYAITFIIFHIIHWILKKEFDPLSILFNGRLLLAVGVTWVTLSLLLGKFFGID